MQSGGEYLELFKWLTPRERDVLGALMHGKSAADIAAESFVAITTTRTHIRSILAKLGVHTLHAAVALAWRVGWQPREEQTSVSC